MTGSGRAFCAGGDLIEFEAALKAGGTKLHRHAALQSGRPPDGRGPAGAGHRRGERRWRSPAGWNCFSAATSSSPPRTRRSATGIRRYGIVPAGGATVRLVERIGPSRAAQLFYTASLVDAETLKDWGLVNEVVPRERLMERAMEIAREICQRSPEANPAHQGADRTRWPTPIRAPSASAPNSSGSRNISAAPTWQRALLRSGPSSIRYSRHASTVAGGSRPMAQSVRDGN